MAALVALTAVVIFVNVPVGLPVSDVKHAKQKFVSFLKLNNSCFYNFFITMNNSGLTTSNPYYDNEDIQEVLNCANDETVWVKVNRFETESSYDFLRITTSNDGEQSKCEIGIHSLKSDSRIFRY